MSKKNFIKVKQARNNLFKTTEIGKREIKFNSVQMIGSRVLVLSWASRTSLEDIREEANNVIRSSVFASWHLKKLGFYLPPETRRDRGTIFSVITFQRDDSQFHGKDIPCSQNWLQAKRRLKSQSLGSKFTIKSFLK